MSEQTKSFSLIRTNPLISGNVKITVDSGGDIWLNSIDATKQLSTSEFKKFRLNLSSSYESDLMNFIGGLSPDIVFAVKENAPAPESTSRFLKDQYDFFYAAGAQPLISDQYDEDYSYFAPMWMREDFPDYFVIFRLDEPLDFPYNENVPSGSIGTSQYIVKGTGFSILYGAVTYTDGQTFTGNGITTTYTSTGTGKVIDLNENKDLPIDRVAQFESIIKRAQVIKTFDLTANSKIGQYIRRMRNNNLFPDAPLSVRFGSGLMSTWNGVAYQDGSMTSKGELLEKFWSDAQLQVDFDEYITGGFKRHGIICPFLLNLEFLFTDDSTPKYSIPRYFGFYVNKIETGLFQLDGKALFDNRAISGNTPSPKRSNKGYRQDGEDFFQNNQNGVHLFYMNEIPSGTEPLFIPSSTDFTTNFEPRIYWVQDKDGMFHSLDQRGNQQYNIAKKDLIIRDDSVNLGNFAGSGNIKLQAKGSLLPQNGRSYMVIKVDGSHTPTDRIFLYWNLGSQSDVDGKYNVIQANDLSKRSFTMPANGTLLTFSGLDLTTEFSIGEVIQIFYNNGQSSVLRTVATLPIFAFGNTTFNIDSPVDLTSTSGYTPIVPGWGPGSAIASEDDLTIYYHPYGTTSEIASAIAKAFNLIDQRTYDAVSVNNEVVLRMRKGESIANTFFCKATLFDYTKTEFQGVVSSPSTKFFFEGGTDRANVRLKFPLEDTDIIKGGESFAKTRLGLSKITFVGRYVDEAILGPGSSEISTLGGFNQYGAFVIEDLLDQPLVTDGSFVVVDLYEIPVGLFSFFDVKDIDGDFFSSTYARSPNNEYHRYFDLLPDSTHVFVPKRTYLVKGTSADVISYLSSTSLSGGSQFGGCPTQGEIGATGNGAIKNFSFFVQFPPIIPGSVVVDPMPNPIETFTETFPGSGILIGNFGGNGTVDYTTGEINVTFITAPPNLQSISVLYDSYAGFEVVSGNPIVTQQIFYNRQITTNEPLIQGHTYLVLGDASDSIVYPAVIGSTFFTNSFFSAGISGASYSIGGGNPIVVEYFTDANDFVLDQDLQAFPGFWKFKDFSAVETERLDRRNLLFSNREKFVHNDINSEYDLLKENFSKEEALKSRVVPTVAKWVYKGGKDIRDNDYRLNTHPVFGQFGLSPSFQVKTQDPASLTHEWYYLEQSPWQLPSQFQNENYYYFDDHLDFSKLTNTNPAAQDYFTDYFTFQPTTEVSDQERFSIFSFNKEIGLSETLFRGVKIRIKEVIRETVQKQLMSNKPPFKDGSTRFVDYKFSCLLRVKKQDRAAVESPVILQVIENKTFKTLTFLVDVIIEDYRTLELQDPSFLGNSMSPISLYPDLQNVAVDYLTLYSIKTKNSEMTFEDSSDLFKIKGSDSHGLGDIKLSVSLNLSSPSGVSYPYTRINAFNNPDYDWDLRDEIKNFNTDNIFLGSFIFAPIFGSLQLPYAISTTQTQILFGIISPPTPVGYPTTQTIGGTPAYTSPGNFLAPAPAPISIPSGAQSDWRGFPLTQIHGGNLYFEPIMQRISFARIAEKINENLPFIKYRTFDWNGFTTVETRDEFYFEMPSPSVVQKNQAIVPQTDEDKPEEFKNEAVIGVSYMTVNAISDLYRYEGNYEPKFKDVLFFAGQKTDEIVGPGVDLSFKQATFNPIVSEFGNIQNLGYLKVSNKEILALAKNKKYKPVYPLLNETPLDFQDFSIFQSSWDPGFYRNYTTKKNFVNQAGTREMQEVKNFFGTKIMKTPKSVRLETFNVDPQLPTIERVDVTKATGEMVFAVDTNTGTINGLIDVRRRMLRFLVEDGANAEFVKNLMPEFGVGDPDSLDDDVLEYLDLNILPEYEVKVVDMYIRRYKENLGLPIVRGDLTDALKLKNSYVVERNFTAQKISNFVYSFTFKLDPSFNVSLAPTLEVGKI